MIRVARHRYVELFKAIRFNLKEGRSFELSCTKKEYYANILARNFPEAKVEVLEDGVRVS